MAKRTTPGDESRRLRWLEVMKKKTVVQEEEVN